MQPQFAKRSSRLRCGVQRASLAHSYAYRGGINIALALAAPHRLAASRSASALTHLRRGARPHKRHPPRRRGNGAWRGARWRGAARRSALAARQRCARFRQIFRRVAGFGAAWRGAGVKTWT